MLGTTVEVEKLELERGGELVYTMTGSGPSRSSSCGTRACR